MKTLELTSTCRPTSTRVLSTLPKMYKYNETLGQYGFQMFLLQTTFLILKLRIKSMYLRQTSWAGWNGANVPGHAAVKEPGLGQYISLYFLAFSFRMTVERISKQYTRRCRVLSLQYSDLRSLVGLEREIYSGLLCSPHAGRALCGYRCLLLKVRLKVCTCIGT